MAKSSFAAALMAMLESARLEPEDTAEVERARNDIERIIEESGLTEVQQNVARNAHRVAGQALAAYYAEAGTAGIPVDDIVAASGTILKCLERTEQCSRTALANFDRRVAERKAAATKFGVGERVVTGRRSTGDA